MADISRDAKVIQLAVPANQNRPGPNLSPNVLTWLQARPQDEQLPKGRRPVTRKTYGLVEGNVALAEEPHFALLWDATEIAVETIDDVFNAMVSRRANNGFFIPGGLSDAAVTANVPRAGGPFGAKDKSIWDIGRAVFWMDFDTAPPFPGDVTKMSWEQIEDHVTGGMLKKIVGDCDRIIHLSNSFGVKPGVVKAHIIVISDKGLTKPDRDALIGEFRQIKVKKVVVSGFLDDAVNRLVQPLFTGDPVFAGMPDPLAGSTLEKRFHIIRGASPKMILPPKTELQHRAAIYQSRCASISGKSSGAENTGAFNTDLGGSPDDPLWARVIAGLTNSFHDEMLYVVRLYAHLKGANDKGGELFARWDAAADTVIKAARGAAYAAGSKIRIRSAYRDWVDVIKKGRSPELQPFTPDIPEVSIREGERLITELAGRLRDNALSLHNARIRHRRAVAEVEAATEAGEHNLARRLATHHGILAIDPDFSPETITDETGWSVRTVEDFESNPFLARLHAGLRASVSLGKTRALVRVALACARANLRVTLNVNAHKLGQQFVDDLVALDNAERGTNPPVKIAIWRGTTQTDPNPEPDNTEKTTCARAKERAALAKAGEGGDWLCGSRKRGFCKFHPKAGGQCLYQRQRKDVHEADIVLCAGAAMLAKEPPKWFRPPRRTAAVLDPATGKKTGVKAAFDPPPVDLTITDELNVLDLVEGAVESKRGEPRSCETTVGDLLAFANLPEDALPGQLAPGPADATDADNQEAAGAARFREALPDAQHAIRTLANAAAAKTGAGGLLTYGDVAEALRENGKAAIDKAHNLAEKIWCGKLECDVDAGDSAAIQEWLAGPAGVWNRRIVTVVKILKALKRARERHQGALEGREVGYLRASLLGEAGALGMGLTARQTLTIRKEWLGGAAVFLDATWQDELSARFLPSVSEVVHANVAAPQDAAFVTQTWDCTFNMTKINRIVEEFEAGKPKRLGKIAKWIEIEARRLNGQGKPVEGQERAHDLLILCTMKLEKALDALWGARKPKNILLWHYGAVRGLNAAKGVAGVTAIGRIMPSTEVLSDLRAIIDGEPTETPITFVQIDGTWRMNANRSMAWRFPKRRTAIADPLANAILEQITYAELEQAVVGRARILRRAGERVEINVLGSSPINGLFVDRLVTTDSLLHRATNPDLDILSVGVELSGLGRKRRSRAGAAVLGLTKEALKKRRQRADASGVGGSSG